jgi:hypothetical protein
VVGWREYVALPELGVKAIKVKVDTGARTSALHAFDVRYVRRRGKRFVRFKIHPHQRSARGEVDAIAPLLDVRRVRSSNGKTEKRPVIETDLEIDGVRWPIELTLTNRDEMGFRMLLGRQAMRGHTMVDPGKSYQTRLSKRRQAAKRRARERRQARS